MIRTRIGRFSRRAILGQLLVWRGWEVHVPLLPVDRRPRVRVVRPLLVLTLWLCLVVLSGRL